MSGKAQNVQANQGSWVTLSRRLRLRSSTQPTGETDLTARKPTSVKTRRGAPTCALPQVTCALSQVTCALPQGWRLDHNGNQGRFCCSVIGEKGAVVMVRYATLTHPTLNPPRQYKIINGLKPILRTTNYKLQTTNDEPNTT